MRNQPVIRYHSVKVSLVVLAIFVLYQLLVVAKGYIYGFDVAFWFLLGIGFFVLPFVYAVQVTVDKESVYISYGIGLVSFDINLSDIERFTIQTNNSFLAWLYNPGGETALRLHLRGNKQRVLPCDEAKKLMNIMKHSV